MNKNLFLLVIALLTFSVSFGQTTQIKLKAKENKFEVKALKSTSFTVESTLATLNLNPISFSEGNFVTLNGKGLVKIYTEGSPNIPVYSKLIEVPQGAEVELLVKSYSEEIIKLSDYGITNLIAPALQSQSKSEESVPFVKNETIYSTDKYSNSQVATFENVGQLRATRLGRIEINPIQYNPVQNSLRVLNNLVIEVNFINADLSKTEALKKKYSSPHFNSVVSTIVINHDHAAGKELITQAPTHMVLVSDRMFEAQLEPFIEWKIKKGFKITEAYTDVIGTTTTDIKTYLEGIYNGSDPMTFVLFVGDVQQIPAWNASGHVTDLRYCEYTGDNLPEVYYGRFSAQNTAQLQPQIDKTLMYEQFTMADPSYLSEVFLVAGDDATYEMTHGNGHIWYGDNYYFNATNNVNAHTYFQPLDNGAMSAVIVNNMNTGLAFANYTAHCGPNGWSSPSFETSDVNALTNDQKYGLWIGNCCNSVEFDLNECFGEAALRKENGGAIGDIGGSNSTYWDEDYWWGVGMTANIVPEPAYEDTDRGVFDGLWHTLANEVNDISTWYTTQGQIQVNGNLAVESSTSTRKQYYWEIYHLMGDPSITNYIGTPQAMTVTPSPSTLMLGMTSLDVSSSPYAYVALSQNGVLIAAAVSDASGNANLSFANDALAEGNADLVVTAQNRIPYIGTIEVTPADEPYVILESYTTSADPNFGETIDLHVALKNVAASGSGYDATGVTATLSITDSYVTINDATETYGTINAGQIVTQNDAFSITIADNVPDQYTFVFDLQITDDNSHTWDTTLTLVANAPAFTIGNLVIDDSASGNSNGILDPGETAELTIQTSNTGHADISNVISMISTSFADLTINTATAPTTSLAVGETKDFVFNVTADAGIADGTEVTLSNEITGGTNDQYTAQKDFIVIIGFVPEYCAAGSDDTSDEFIEQVLFETIDNSSTQGPAYTDYTNISTNIQVGQSYELTIINGESFSSDQMGCWIDWNYDGDFDDSNEYFVVAYQHDIPSTGLGTGTATITVPTDARLGNTTMRLRVLYTGSIEPCGNSSYGEVEDYTVYVHDPSASIEEDDLAKINVYPNPNTGTFTVDLRSLNVANEVTVELFNINGQLIYQRKATNSSFEVNTHQKNGVYFLRLTSGLQVLTKKVIISK